MTSTHLVTFAGWEPRFLTGTTRACLNLKPKKITIFHGSLHQEETGKSIAELEEFTSENSIEMQIVPLDFDNQIETWKTIYDTLEDLNSGTKATVDISTMPREVVWYILFILSSNKVEVEYFYNSPKSYDKEWLTQDASTPRLALKVSGISYLQRKTVLIIVTGFDAARAEQIVNHFEPYKTIFAIQSGNQYDNDTRNREMHECLAQRIKAETFVFDSYIPDHGYEQLKRYCSEYASEYNVVLASLGPKLSSIALFRLSQDAVEPESIALCYAPSRLFNVHYSHDIADKPYTGKL